MSNMSMCRAVQSGEQLAGTRPASRSQDRSWSPSESTVCLESVQVFRLRLWIGIAEYHTSTDDGVGRTLMHRPENIETQEDEETGTVEIKLKRHLVTKFRQINDIGDILGPSRSLCDSASNSKIVIPGPSKGISDNHGRLHSQLVRTGAVLPYQSPVRFQSTG